MLTDNIFLSPPEHTISTIANSRDNSIIAVFMVILRHSEYFDKIRERLWFGLNTDKVHLFQANFFLFAFKQNHNLSLTLT